VEVIPTAMALDVGREEERFMVEVNALFKGEDDFETVKGSPASRGPEARRMQRRTMRAGKPRVVTLTTISLLLELALVIIGAESVSEGPLAVNIDVDNEV